MIKMVVIYYQASTGFFLLDQNGNILFLAVNEEPLFRRKSPALTESYFKDSILAETGRAQ